MPVKRHLLLHKVKQPPLLITTKFVCGIPFIYPLVLSFNVCLSVYPSVRMSVSLSFVNCSTPMDSLSLLTLKMETYETL